MSNPKITVLMSVFNDENTVGKSIESVLSQTYGDFQFIIIDDGSDDKTLDLVRSFKDKRLEVISNPRNIGLTKSLNKGLEYAKGKYIARIDSDDICLNDRFKKQLDFLESNPDFSLCGTSYTIIDGKGNNIRDVVYDKTPEEIYYDLHFQNIIAHSTVMFKKKGAIVCGGYKQKYRYSQDYALWQCLSEIEKANILPDKLLKWSSRKDNISNKKGFEQRDAAREIFYRNLLDKGISSKEISRVECFHNFYNRDYLKQSAHILLLSLEALRNVNDVIVRTVPCFYDRKTLKDLSYKKLVYLMADILKKTKHKSTVLKYIFKNIYDFKLDVELLRKVLKK